MEKFSRSQDEVLVRACIAGSEVAWQEFYSRFIGLMRAVIKKRFILCKEDVEDITQSAFVSLATALNNFDYEQSLPRFVCVITERVAIDEYRKWKTARRNAESQTGQLDFDLAVSPETKSDIDLPDRQMERAERASCLGAAMKELDLSCRELLTLRYLKDLSYKEIAERFGVSENTLTVQARRCLEKLRIKYRDAERRGFNRWENQIHQKKPVIRTIFCCLMLKVY
ncbi:MAG: RNA polymerase sigma factor [Desulfomonilaceae bacterium]